MSCAKEAMYNTADKQETCERRHHDLTLLYKVREIQGPRFGRERLVLEKRIMNHEMHRQIVIGPARSAPISA
jgi:hypothetical protein